MSSDADWARDPKGTALAAGSRWRAITADQMFYDGFVRERAAKESGEQEDYENSEHLEQIGNPADAEIVSSTMREHHFFQPYGGPGSRHKVLIDIDMPVLAVPSTTPGHYHLYIDKMLTWPQYVRLLEVLGEVGIVEEGYVEASKRRGCTHLRVPWLAKPKHSSYPEPVGW